MSYEVVISRRAAKELKGLPNQEISRIFHKIKSLGDEPRPIGCKKLSGNEEELYRIRSGDYRVIYSIDDVVRIIDVRQIGHRREVYK